MFKQAKKFIAASLVGVVALTGGTTLIVNASNQDTNIRIELDAWRSLLTGSIRGQAVVRTRNAIRSRVVVTTSNSNGTTSVTTDPWSTRDSWGGILSTGSEQYSQTISGTSRVGTVRGDGQRRATSTGAWSSSLSTSQKW